jgi:3-hydroxyacyl-[acyl-carrier-protein] dehydratase
VRWIWIDRVVELSRGERLVAVKNVTLAEDHLHDHLGPVRDGAGLIVREALPVMPASLIVEGMAQSAGILVGHAERFRQKVILAKVSRARLERDATPGCTLRYTAEIAQSGAQGAVTRGLVELRDNGDPGSDWAEIGRIDLMFSHLDQNMAGLDLPDHNFVFNEAFRTLLRTSGIECDF